MGTSWRGDALQRAQGAGATAHRQPMVECGDPAGQGVLGAPRSPSPCWQRFPSGRLWFNQSPRSWHIIMSKLLGNLSAALLQGTVVTDAASQAARGGDPEQGTDCSLLAGAVYALESALHSVVRSGPSSPFHVNRVPQVPGGAALHA